MSALFPPAPELRNFAEVLQWQGVNHPDKTIFRFLTDGETREESITYSQLDDRARGIADRLSVHAQKGDRVLLLLTPGIDFIAAFFGCLYAGCVAIPTYPHLRQKKDSILTRILNVAADAEPKAILSNDVVERASAVFFAESEHTRDIPWLDVSQIPPLSDADWRGPSSEADDLAFLQYTSGSTNTPKGVMVSHGNLMHNAMTITNLFGLNPDDRCVLWLPPYHDMGLIGGILTPVFAGVETIHMAPAYFLQRPIRWLQAVTRFRATVTGAPNFAYDYAVKKVKPEQLAGLDLSTLAVAFSGAEPINADTLLRFADYFAPTGFQESTFLPCYGLAEGTLMITSQTRGNGFVSRRFNKTALEQHRVAPDPENGRPLVGCGSTDDDTVLRITDPHTLLPTPEGQIGEIWAGGGSIAQGYWNRPEATRETFQAFVADTGEGPFMRTGDLGFVQHNQLFITGRIKSLIIIDGSNHYPQDIEWTVEHCHPDIQPHGAAAFSVDLDGAEKLIIVAELDQRTLRDLTDEQARAIKRAITGAVANEHALSVHDIVFTGRLPKTTSGKIKHHECRAEYLESLTNPQAP
ncbi:MAG: fatty acyl-AMP ligase [Saprospiraceae bacterium]|nr:fatty acyl-AMP ligase [Saprospiraceae bacterium]